MNQVQQHRGPDDQGVYHDPHNQVSLAMRRLSIVALADGHQPMVDRDRRRIIVFNGEIFNAPALRRDLEAEGYGFFTDHSDTEVLLYLYDRYGRDMVRHLNGMFSFVIYDQPGGCLFGARDHTGIKPLYWLQQQGRLAFASEIKSLLALPFVEHRLDFKSAHHYFTLQFIPPPRSIFAGIAKLPPGHHFSYRIKSQSLEVARYWAPPVFHGLEPGETPDRAKVVEQLRRLLLTVVRDWLMSDVPVGCSLSGGLDSSAVVALMAELGINPIRTWTLGFEEAQAQDLDERRLARLVAKQYHTDHHEITVRGESLLDDLEQMVWHLDEPYAGGLPSWFVFREMSREVKVAMTGSGGDELFGNYGKWQVFRPRSLYWLKTLLKRIQSNGWRNFWDYPHGTLYHGYFGELEKRFLRPVNSDKTVNGTPAFLERLWQEAGTRDPKSAVAYIDLQLQLPEEFLLMTDRFSMAWSLEARTPLLDHRLIEFVLRLPPEVRTYPRDLKKLFKEAVGALLPAELLLAKKSGFVLPVGHWLRGRLRPLVEETLRPEFLAVQGLFSSGIYEKYVAPHLQGRRDNSWQVWTLLMFQLWWLQHGEGMRGQGSVPAVRPSLPPGPGEALAS